MTSGRGAASTSRVVKGTLKVAPGLVAGAAADNAAWGPATLSMLSNIATSSSRRAAGSAGFESACRRRSASTGELPPKTERLTFSITCWASSPRTMGSTMRCDGSTVSTTSGLSWPPNSARPACAPKPAGNSIAARDLPALTAAAPSAAVASATCSVPSARSAATIWRVSSLWSRSVTVTGMSAGLASSLPNRLPKKAAIRMGAAMLMMTERRLEK